MINKERELCRLILTTDFETKRIAGILNVNVKTIKRRREKLHELGLSWVVIQGMNDNALLEKIKPTGGGRPKLFWLPDWDEVERDSHKKGVTKTLLHEEYRSFIPPMGFAVLSKRHFGRLMGLHRARLGLTMRQTHIAGEKLFVDFSGKKIFYYGENNEKIWCEVFVATWGASSATYSEAVHSQTLQDWIMAHVRCFEYFGGAPKILVPDCLRSAVTCWRPNNVDITPAYQEVAAHYGAVVEPARPGHPKDKGKVEVAVKLVQMWILAVLRRRTFYSINEINAAIRELLVRYNNRPFRRRPDTTRQKLFDTIDRPHYTTLPAISYEYGQWHTAVVPEDYHILADDRHYSVPHGLRGKSVHVKLLDDSVRVYHLNQEVARHPRNRVNYDDTTVHFHCHPNHRAILRDNVDYLLSWAELTGTEVGGVMRRIVADAKGSRLTLQQSMSAVKGLADKYGPAKLKAACHRALLIGCPTYTSLKSMLASGMESAAVRRYDDDEPSPPRPTNKNVRGAGYFAGRK